MTRMGKQTQDGESDRVDAAFNRVLAAEAQARDQVEECRRQAAVILAAAEERARHIVNRADRRIRRAHRIADASVERALTELLATRTETEQDNPEGEALTHVDRAIAALVEEILAPEARAGS
jgi:vacuolar-type H+-ATPase subunit H